MDEDLAKLKPYITNLKRHLIQLKPELKNLTKDSLNDKLITTINEQDKLDLVNNYSYILNSLLFAYMKLIGSKNLDQSVLIELKRCKEYMSKSTAIKNRRSQSLNSNDSKQDKLKSSIVASLNNNIVDSSISKENFIPKNKHIKFNDSKKNDKKYKISK